MSRPVVAVVPFGAPGGSPRAGAWARQLARRLVDRFAGDGALEVRPVFLVAMPEDAGDAGYLVIGSAPDPDLAARYATSLGATHALTATWHEEAAERAISAVLVDAPTRAIIAAERLAIAPDALHLAEPALARWLTGALGVSATTDLASPAAASEPAFAALLEAMDEEVNATLLRGSDPVSADRALAAALARYLEAARLDPTTPAAEERLLVLAAESLERHDVSKEIEALETLVTLRPRSWRAHYVLGRLRALRGDANGAIVAFEHAHSIHPLPDDDIVRLAELYANVAAPAPALAHLRRVGQESTAYGAAQELLAIISFQRGDEGAGREAFAHAVAAGAASWELHASYGALLHAHGALDDATARYRSALEAGGPAVVRLNLARALLAAGDAEGSARELDALLAGERAGEVAGHARRLRFGIREPALESELERAGQAALAAEDTALSAARTVFERSLAAEPDLWEAEFGLGIVARREGRATEAEASFRRVLELWPDQPDALHELGVALLMRGGAAAALVALDRAAAQRPDDPAYLADAGFAHLRSGDLANARVRLERAAALDGGDEITRAYLAELERAESARTQA